MLALSVQQPWPWLIFHGGKDIENRDWSPPATLVGHRLAIHASLRRQSIEPAEVMEDVFGWGVEKFWDRGIPKLAELPVGVLLGTVRLVGVTFDGCTPGRDGKKSKWFVGRAGWIFEDPRALTEPIPARGALGLWPVPVSAVPLLEAA